MKNNRIYIIIIFLIFLQLSCNKSTDYVDIYQGEKVFEGQMIFKVDTSKLISEHIMSINAKIKTLYKGYGRIKSDLPKNWIYIGNDSAFIYPFINSPSDSIIDLMGYINANEYFSKDFIFKIPESDIENNKIQIQFIEYLFKYDSLWDKKLNKMLTPRSYNEINSDSILDAILGFHFSLWF